MLADRIFRKALVASVILHIFIFYNWPPLKNLPILKTYDKLEVTYYPVRPAPSLSGLIEKEEKRGKPPQPTLLKSAAENPKAEDLARPAVDLKIVRKKPGLKILQVEKDNLARHIPSEEKMLISHQDKDLSNRPTYINYYNALRSQIYKVANANKPYFFMEGEVRLVFTVARDGNLINAEVVKEASVRNPILHNHALMSIRKASPFPPFHQSIKENELTLRLTISFEK